MNDLPTAPPVPPALLQIEGEPLRQRAVEVWSAAWVIHKSEQLFRNWLQELKQQGDADPGFLLRLRATCFDAAECLKTLAGIHLSLAQLPPSPSGILDPPWQKDTAFLEAYKMRLRALWEMGGQMLSVMSQVEAYPAAVLAKRDPHFAPPRTERKGLIVKAHRALICLLDTQDSFENLLRLGRRSWSISRAAFAPNLAPVSYEHEVQRLFDELDKAAIETRRAVYPIRHALSDTHRGLRFERYGIGAKNCALWIIQRADLVREPYDIWTAEVVPPGTGLTIEQAVAVVSLPAPYDRTEIVEILEEELRRAQKKWRSQSRRRRLESNLSEAAGLLNRRLREFRKGHQGTINDEVVRFVDELDRVDGGTEELRRRANIVELTSARGAAKKLLQQWKSIRDHVLSSQKRVKSLTSVQIRRRGLQYLVDLKRFDDALTLASTKGPRPPRRQGGRMSWPPNPPPTCPLRMSELELGREAIRRAISNPLSSWSTKTSQKLDEVLATATALWKEASRERSDGCRRLIDVARFGFATVILSNVDVDAMIDAVRAMVRWERTERAESNLSRWEAPQKWRPLFEAAGHSASSRSWPALREKFHGQAHPKSGSKLVRFPLADLKRAGVDLDAKRK